MLNATKHQDRAFGQAFPSVDPHELGRPHHRFRNPVVTGGLEGLRQALYDTYRVAVSTAAPTVPLFQQPIGQSYNFGGVTPFQKTILHTNMKNAGVLQSPNKALIRAIKVRIVGLPGTVASPQFFPFAAPIDIANLMYATYAEFDVNDKAYFQGEPAELPQGGGMHGATGSTTAATTTIPGAVVNGWPDSRNMWGTVYDGISIEQTQSFQFVLDPSKEAGGAFTTLANNATPLAGTGLNVKVELDGILFRSIQ